MTLSHTLRRLLAGDRPAAKRARQPADEPANKPANKPANTPAKPPGHRGDALVRNAVAWIFIALVALFLTEHHSLFDGPVPLPAELGLEPDHPR